MSLWDVIDSNLSSAPPEPVPTPKPASEPDAPKPVTASEMRTCGLCLLPIVPKSSHLVLACSHVYCYACILPLIKSGKDYCAACPSPETRGGAPIDTGNDSDVHFVAQRLAFDRDQVRQKLAEDNGALRATLRRECR